MYHAHGQDMHMQIKKTVQMQMQSMQTLAYQQATQHENMVKSFGTIILGFAAVTAGNAQAAATASAAAPDCPATRAPVQGGPYRFGVRTPVQGGPNGNRKARGEARCSARQRIWCHLVPFRHGHCLRRLTPSFGTSASRGSP